MYMFPNAPTRGLRKIQKIVKNYTFLDFLTPKYFQLPPKRPAPTSPSSMPIAREIGLSKGPNSSRWWLLENGQNDHFFPKIHFFGPFDP